MRIAHYIDGLVRVLPCGRPTGRRETQADALGGAPSACGCGLVRTAPRQRLPSSGFALFVSVGYDAGRSPLRRRGEAFRSRGGASTMCEPCRPMCGKCKPAEIVPIHCSACGRVTFVSREACLHALGRPHRVTKVERAKIEAGEIGDALCRHCGADQRSDIDAQIPPQDCVYSGIVCGFPCGRRTRPRRPNDEVCPTQVPMARRADSPCAGGAEPSPLRARNDSPAVLIGL